MKPGGNQSMNDLLLSLAFKEEETGFLSPSPRRVGGELIAIT